MNTVLESENERGAERERERERDVYLKFLGYRSSLFIGRYSSLKFNPHYLVVSLCCDEGGLKLTHLLPHLQLVLTLLTSEYKEYSVMMSEQVRSNL